MNSFAAQSQGETKNRLSDLRLRIKFGGTCSLSSTQQIKNLRLKLRFIIRPIAIDLPRAPAECAAGRHAPRIDRFMCGCEFGIATDMRSHDDLACGRLRADDLAFALKGANDLHAEIDDHCYFARRSVMVKEAIMAVGPETFM